MLRPRPQASAAACPWARLFVWSCSCTHSCTEVSHLTEIVCSGSISMVPPQPLHTRPDRFVNKLNTRGRNPGLGLWQQRLAYGRRVMLWCLGSGSPRSAQYQRRMQRGSLQSGWFVCPSWFPFLVVKNRGEDVDPEPDKKHDCGLSICMSQVSFATKEMSLETSEIYETT